MNFPIKINQRDLDEGEAFNLQLLAEERSVSQDSFPLFREEDGRATTIVELSSSNHDYDLTNGVYG